MRRTQRARLWAGLAVLGAMVLGGREAQAALTGITITGSGGTVTGSDPQYFYSLDLTINPGFEMVPGKDTITVYGFLGVTSDSLSDSPDPPAPFHISHHDFSNPDDPKSDARAITWSVSSTISAGDYQPFVIDTARGLPSSFGPVTLTYSAVLNGGTFKQPSSGDGSGLPITIDFVSTPEPSTLVFLVSAAAVAPIAILVRRWRRRGSPVAA
jgi:hypothetical protein